MQIKSIIYFTGLLFVATLSGCQSENPPTTLSDRVIAQETPLWCWAAMTQMLTEHFDLHISQCNIASHYRRTHHTGSTAGNAAQATEQCCTPMDERSDCPKTNDCSCSGLPEWDYAGLQCKTNNCPLSWSAIQSQIYCDHKPLGYFYSPHGGLVGHMVVIVGYASIGGTDYLVINDPLPQCKTDLGRRMIPYNDYASANHFETYSNLEKR
jgi:hypothetical protein